MEQKLRNFIADIQAQSKNSLHFTTLVYSEERNTTTNIVFSSKSNPNAKENTIWIDSKLLKANRYVNNLPVQIFYYGDLFAFFPRDAEKEAKVEEIKPQIEVKEVEVVHVEEPLKETPIAEIAEVAKTEEVEIIHATEVTKAPVAKTTNSKKSNSSKRG
jgi:hypothetical protein